MLFLWGEEGYFSNYMLMNWHFPNTYCILKRKVFYAIQVRKAQWDSACRYTHTAEEFGFWFYSPIPKASSHRMHLHLSFGTTCSALSIATCSAICRLTWSEWGCNGFHIINSHFPLTFQRNNCRIETSLLFMIWSQC